jgi:CBS-domain-containing membrane protein
VHARDVMTSSVVTARPETTLMDIVQIMLVNHVSAVPIIDAEDRLVGIVSEGDLVRRTEIGTDHPRSWWLSAFGSVSVLAEDFIKSHGVTAAEIMTPKVIVGHEDTPLSEIAETLAERKFKGVPILRDQRVVGMVSRSSLLQALALQRLRMMEAPSREDGTIRAELMKLLKGERWADLSHVNVLVKDSIVHLWGSVRTEKQRDALSVVARSVPGVRDVVNHAHISIALV